MSEGQTLHSSDVTDVTHFINYAYILALLIAGLYLALGKTLKARPFLIYCISLALYWGALLLLDANSEYFATPANEIELSIGLSLTLAGNYPLYSSFVFIWAPAVLYFLSRRRPHTYICTRYLLVHYSW